MLADWLPARHHRVALLGLVVVIAALISAGQIYHNWNAYGASVRFSTIFGVKLVEWMLWALVVPAIVFLDKRAGFRRRTRWVAGAVHLVAAITWVLAMNAVLTVLGQLIDPTTGDTGFGALYANRLIFKLPAGLGVYGFILAAYGIVHLLSARYADSVREAQLETELTTARLRNLHMQLQPHFLFNALHSIGALVREGEGERAVDMIAELSELLRRALGTADRQEVTLEEELDFLDHYVRIQQVRFADRLRLRYEIEAEARSALIPCLLLQPLVENAIRHGLERTSRVVEIVISARATDSRIVLEVSDSGPGPGTEAIIEGVGLGTTRQRLVHLYGDQQSFALGRRPGGGTLVCLQVPRRAGPVEES